VGGGSTTFAKQKCRLCFVGCWAAPMIFNVLEVFLGVWNLFMIKKGFKKIKFSKN